MIYLAVALALLLALTAALLVLERIAHAETGQELDAVLDALDWEISRRERAEREAARLARRHHTQAVYSLRELLGE